MTKISDFNVGDHVKVNSNGSDFHNDTGYILQSDNGWFSVNIAGTGEVWFKRNELVKI